MEAKAEDSNGLLSFYLGVNETDLLPEIPQTAGSETPLLARDCSDLVAAIAAGNFTESNDCPLSELAAMLRNKVKKCSRCGKPNAFTLASCNSCGNSLTETEVSYTNNIFMGFVFGIQKGPFPYTISIRHQNENFLFFDDLLALSPLHFNAIPTTQWIPDWRYLLRKPKTGLELINDLYAQCVRIGSTQYLSNDRYTTKLFKQPFSTDDFLAGFNYPPSQYQLHLQFMAPVLMPQQRYLFERGIHFTHGRFFPIGYVRRCLALATESPLPKALLLEDSDMKDIVSHFREMHAYDYDTVHADFLTRAEALWQKYANWDAGDFKGEAVLGLGGVGKEKELVFVPKDNSEKTISDQAEVQQLINDDKVRLQSYGRPYSDSGKPTNTYYSFAKKLGSVRVW